jgi:hypothetical protein
MALPGSTVQRTTFPAAYGKDVEMAVRIIEDRWTRSYPQVEYLILKQSITEQGGGGISAPVGASGTTLFDPLYGESLDPTMLSWDQPHLSASNTANESLDATDVEQFETGILVSAQVRREATERELKKYGFDEIRDLLLTIPTSLLDGAGIDPKPGDRFKWDGDTYSVLQRKRGGYWKNTNVALYEVINAEHARFGA